MGEGRLVFSLKNPQVAAKDALDRGRCKAGKLLLGLSH